MNLKTDFHIHTWYSDGTLSPSEIVQKYSCERYDVIAITDHETTAGIKEAEEKGREVNLKVVAGIELPAVFEGKELHILGYHFDLKNRALTEKLDFMAEKRRERNARLLKAIREKGYEIEEQDLIFREGQTYIGKPNFARALIKKGYISKVSEAFEPGRFLEDPQLKEIKKYLIPAEEALTIIRDAGGIPVLAHPCKIRGIGRRGSEEFRDSFSQLLKRLRQAGLKGLECIYPDHTEEERLFFIDEAARLHLHITEGSDFHGDR